METKSKLIAVACDRENMRGDVMRAVHEAQLYLGIIRDISRDPEEIVRAREVVTDYVGRVLEGLTSLENSLRGKYRSEQQA